MSFTGSAQTEDEPPPTGGYPRLVRVAHDTRIEQRRSFERILVHEIRADQAALVLRKRDVGREGRFHFRRALLKSLEQVTVPTEEIVEHISQLTRNGGRVQCQNAINDVICAGFVCGIEVARLGRRLEWTHNDPCRIGAQIQGLPVEECGA